MRFCLHDGRALTPHPRAVERGKHFQKAGIEQAAGSDHQIASDHHSIKEIKNANRAREKGLRAMRSTARKEEKRSHDYKERKEPALSSKGLRRSEDRKKLQSRNARYETRRHQAARNERVAFLHTPGATA